MRALTDITLRKGDVLIDLNETGGAWWLRSPVDRKRLAVISSANHGWDHVSVSRADRTPVWDEMEFVKRRFFLDNEVAVQFHVPVREHINVHPHCLHLWRPQAGRVVLPPAFLV